MSLDLDALLALVGSNDYQRVPLSMVEEQSPGKRWWQLQEHMTELSARLQVWEAAQFVALLFDTYGQSIQSVELRFSAEVQRQDVYVSNYVRINDEEAYERVFDMDEEIRDTIETHDGSRVLWAVVDALNDVASSLLSNQLALLTTAFDGPITSAEKAREIARQHAGVVGAHIEATLLERLTPSSPRRGMGQGRL